MSLVKNIGIGKDKWWSYLKDTLHLDCSKCTLRKDETFGYVVDVHGQNIHLSAFPYKNLPDFIKFGNYCCPVNATRRRKVPPKCP